MTQTQTHAALGYLSARQLPPLTAMALGIVVLVAKWEERRRTRRALKRLEPHLLRDVGLSQDDVARELGQRFRQP